MIHKEVLRSVFRRKTRSIDKNKMFVYWKPVYKFLESNGILSFVLWIGTSVWHVLKQTTYSHQSKFEVDIEIELVPSELL